MVLFTVACEIKNSPTQQPLKKEGRKFSHTAASKEGSYGILPHSSLPKKEVMGFSTQQPSKKGRYGILPHSSLPNVNSVSVVQYHWSVKYIG